MRAVLLVLSLPIVWELAGIVAAGLGGCWLAQQLERRRTDPRHEIDVMARRAGRKQRSTQ